MSDTNGRKPGGQPGNLNRAKTAVPALKRLQLGQPLTDYLERITSLADFEAGELVSDKGGIESMTGGEKLLVSNWKSARMAELLIWHYYLKTTVAVQLNKEKSTWDLQPGMQRLSVFLAEQRRCVMALGLERRAKPVQDLQAYLAETYSAEGEK